MMRLFSVCLLSLFLFSCNLFSSKEKRTRINSDSLKPTVSYFLVGRIRTTQVESGVPFTIKVIKFNPELFGNRMAFRMLDSTKFKIIYTQNDKPVEIVGSYGKEFITSDFDIMVSKTDVFDKIYARDIRNFNFLFAVNQE